jgi:hypothetical protein
VAYGESHDYTLNGGCSATSWSVGCGTVSFSDATHATIFFNATNCSSTTVSTDVQTANPLPVSISGSNPPPPTLTGGAISNPSQTISFGGTPAQITASAASGGSCGGSYTYQWYSSTDGTNYSPISGATGQNYQPGTLTVTTFFKRLTSCAGSTAFTTNVATVTVTPQLQSGSIGNPSQTIAFGGTPAQLSASAASGGNCGGSYTYQWYSSTDNTNFSAISGATGLNYQPGALTVTTWYRMVTTCGGATVTSNTATVTVTPQLQPGTISPSFQVIDFGSTATQLTAPAATGGNCGGSYFYQWYSSPDGSSYSPISGATGQNYQPGSPTATAVYHRVTTCGGETATTDDAEIDVRPQLIGGTLNPPSQTINAGGTASTLTLSGVSGGSGGYAYLWESSQNASFSGGTFFDNGSSMTFTPTGLGSTTYYRVEVLSGSKIVFSSAAVVNVYPPVQVGAITLATQTINFDATPAALTVSGVAGGNGTYSYQWQSSTDPAFGSFINVGTGGLSYSPPNPGTTTYYRLMVTSNGVSAYSSPAVINVIPPLSGGTISGNTGPILYNSSPGQLSSTQDASGGACSGSYTYQWQYSFDGTTWHDLLNGAGTTYSSATGLTISEYFRRQVSCNGTNAWSNTIHVQVNSQKQASCTQ